MSSLEIDNIGKLENKDNNNNSETQKISKNEKPKNEDNNEENKHYLGKYDTEILSVPNEYSEYEINFKLIIIGNSGVGKTCITNKAVKNVFSNKYQSTIGMEIYSLFIKIDNKIIKLQIWDTCGQEIYRSLITNFYRSSSLAIIVYAIDQRDSFKDLDLWIKELKLNNSPDTKLILIGNKLDLAENRQVSYNEGKQFSDEFGFLDFFETSAKTGENIKNMFIRIANVLYEEHLKFKDTESTTSYNTFRPSFNNGNLRKSKAKKASCC